MKFIFSFFTLFLFVFSSFSQGCWKMVAKGSVHSVAIRADGTLWTWGQNTSGQLGDGSGYSTIVPVQVGTLSTWDKVYAKYNNSFAIMKDGSLWGWGQNSAGELGDGTQEMRTVPVKIGNATDWQVIETNFNFTCALKKDGSLWTWGYNANGQLGNGTTTNQLTPKKVGSDKNWKSISIGSSTVMALKTDGTLWGWGNNYYNQLGNTPAVDVLNPVQIGIETNWKNVSCGNNHVMAVRTNGSLWTWGANHEGQIGNGGANNYQSEPLQLGSDMNWETTYAIQNWSIALKTDGTLWSWGSGYGYYNSMSVVKKVPTQFGTGTDWQSLYPSEEQTLAFKRDGSLWTWGSNRRGELGLGLYGDTYTPYGVNCPEPLKSSCWKSASIVEYISIGLRTDSTLWQWGIDYTTELDNYDRDVVELNRIGTDKWRSYAFSGFLVAIKSDGTLWQSGGRNIPILLSADTDWKDVAVGQRGYAIKQDGSLWKWELDAFTNNTQINGVIPEITQLNAGTQWQSISAAKYTTAAIRSDGSLWIWGASSYGAMGTGTASGSSQVPIQMGSDTDWQSVSVSEFRTMAIKTDGTLWACGRNEYGQLGDGTFTDKYVLTQIGTESNWKTVVAGPFHTLAIKTDGTLSSWGSYSYNKLGLGYDRNGNQLENNWQSVAASSYNSFGIHADGTLYTVGNNDYAQLGIEDYRTTGPASLYCSVVQDPDPISTNNHTRAYASEQKCFVYPNPNNGTFTITGSKNADVYIYNVEGRLVKSIVMSDTKEQMQIDLVQGIYYFVIRDVAGSSSGTFIIQ